MSDKKFKSMSVSMETEMIELIENASKTLGVKKSELIRELIEKYLDCVMQNSEKIPVILQIPVDLKGNPVELKKWLDARVDLVIKSLGS
jgi:hypothetical protein